MLAFRIFPLFLVLFAAVAPAAVLHVGQGGEYSTIDAAITAAHNGDEIHLADGVYEGSIQIVLKSIAISGSANAVILGQKGGNPTPAITLSYAQGVSITGVTVRTQQGDFGPIPSDGPPDYQTGGETSSAIFVSNSTVTLSNLIVEVYGSDDTDAPQPPAIEAENSDLTINGGRYTGSFGRDAQSANPYELTRIATRGGPGLRCKNCHVMLQDAVLVGGPGGKGYDYVASYPSQRGGDALEDLGSSLIHAVDSQFYAGNSGPRPGAYGPGDQSNNVETEIATVISTECGSETFLRDCYLQRATREEAIQTSPGEWQISTIEGEYTSGCGYVQRQPNIVRNATSGQQYDTINGAIGAANPGDEIDLQDGVYEETVMIAKDDITLSGTLNAIIHPPLADPLRGASAIIIDHAEGVSINGVTCRTRAGGIQFIGTNLSFTTGELTSDAIVIRDARATLSDLTVEVYGTDNTSDHQPAALDLSNSEVTVLGGRYTGSFGLSMNQYYSFNGPGALNSTRGGPGIRSSNSKMLLKEVISVGGQGSQGAGSPYGPQEFNVPGRMGGNATELLGSSLTHCINSQFYAGDSLPLKDALRGPVANELATAVAILNQCGSTTFLKDCYLQKAKNYRIEYIPFTPSYNVVEFEGELFGLCGVLIQNDECAFADALRILGIANLPAVTFGSDQILDAADVAVSSQSTCVLSEPWWQ